MKKFIFVLSLLAAHSAMANDLYAGLSSTQSRLDSRLDAPVDTDMRGHGLRIHVGHQMHPGLAVEASYGETRGMSVGREKLKSSETTLSMVARMPVSRSLGILGKLGLAYTELGSPSLKGRATDLVYGAGAEYRFTPKVSLVGEVEQFRNYAGSDEAVNQANVGLRYRF